jgi:hypothetical protein
VDDPNMTNDERAVLLKLKGKYNTAKERDLGVKRAVLASLQRRGYLRFLGGDIVQITPEGERALLEKKTP